MASAYAALSSKDTDTLYFIADQGLLYKGDKPYGGTVKSVSNANNVLKITLHTGTEISVPYTVASDLTALHTTLTGEITTHAAITGNSSTNGHLKLSDSTSSTSSTSGGTAATPKAVKDALAAAKTYADNLAAANDAMVFKGTLGTSGTVTTLPSTGYKVGYTYRVITAATYAGKVCEVGDLVICVKSYASSASNDDWTVAQTNIDGAVTAASALTNGSVMLGSGNKAAKVLANGTDGQVLKMVSGSPAWSTDNNSDTKVSIANSNNKMYLIGTSNATGTQTGVSNTKVFATNGKLTAETFEGSGANLTNLPATAITGAATAVTAAESKVVTGAAVATYIEETLTWGSF